MQREKMRTWTEIRAWSLAYNVHSMRQKLPPDCKFMGMVKADAYGHGSVGVSRFLETIGVDYLAVACIDEAEKIRRAGNKLPMLILGVTPPEFTQTLVELDVAQTVGDLATAKEYAQRLAETGDTLKVHIKLETGMGRLGFNVKNGEVMQAAQAALLPNLEAEGIFTHFAVSDEPEKHAYTKRQFELFMAAVQKIEQARGARFKIRHCANSGAMINYPEMYLDMVRPGIALYGIHPGSECGGINLSPVMALKSRISAVSDYEKGDCISYGCRFTAEKKLRVAVLPIGYADGLHRSLSGKIEVLIRGRRCRQLGTICMDMCMVDVTDVPDVKAGDVATLIGEDGGDAISAKDLAEKAGTIPYEIVCAISERVPRLIVI